MSKYLILSGLVFCTLSASAGEEIAFATVDANNDGFVSESEFVSWKTADASVSPVDALIEFIEIDSDASGMISEAEMQAAMAKTEEEPAPSNDGM